MGIDFGRKYREPKAVRFQGYMKFEFIIDTNGNMIRIGVQGKQEKEATSYEKEGLKVLRSLPKWKAGKCNGKVVPVKIMFPVQF
ncbi:Gram-negative bacterial tonB protein [compost metagenome]